MVYENVGKKSDLYKEADKFVNAVNAHVVNLKKLPSWRD
jgi:hypothetical protein